MDEDLPVTATGIAAIGLLTFAIVVLAYMFGPDGVEVRCSCAIAVIDGDVSHVLIEPSSSLPEIARPDLRAADLRRADQGNGGVREAGVEGGGTPRAPGATGSR